VLFVHAAIITAVVETLGLALNLFKHISEACSAFGTERALVQSVSEKLNVISHEVKPLHGQRLHTDAAVLAVKQLEKHLDTWKPQLTASVFFSWRIRQIWRILGNSVGELGKIAWQFSPNSVAK
jgi:hypothetical protein